MSFLTVALVVLIWPFHIVNSNFKNCYLGAVKVLVAKPDDPGFIPSTHMQRTFPLSCPEFHTNVLTQIYLHT